MMAKMNKLQTIFWGLIICCKACFGVNCSEISGENHSFDGNTNFKVCDITYYCKETNKIEEAIFDIISMRNQSDKRLPNLTKKMVKTYDPLSKFSDIRYQLLNLRNYNKSYINHLSRLVYRTESCMISCWTRLAIRLQDNYHIYNTTEKHIVQKYSKSFFLYTDWKRVLEHRIDTNKRKDDFVDFCINNNSRENEQLHNIFKIERSFIKAWTDIAVSLTNKSLPPKDEIYKHIDLLFEYIDMIHLLESRDDYKYGSL